MKTFDIYFYHANCTDGLAAIAVALKGVDTDKVEVVAASYSTPIDPSQTEGKDVCFLDFSARGEILKDILKVAKTVTIIDHHVSVYDEIREVESDPATKGKLTYIYNVSKSGAMLAWDYFNGDVEYPYAIKLISDRDIWTGLYKDTSAFALALRVEEFTLERMCKLLQQSDEQHIKLVKALVAKGESYQVYNDYLVRQIASHSHLATLSNDMVVSMVNCPLGLVSDVGNYLAETQPAGVALMVYHKEKEVVYSIRVAADTDFNAGAYCRDYHGGGGHAKAAGWVESIQYS